MFFHILHKSGASYLKELNRVGQRKKSNLTIYFYKTIQVKFINNIDISIKKLNKKHFQLLLECKPHNIRIVVVCMNIRSRSDSNRTGSKGLSFYHSRPLCYPDQTLGNPEKKCPGKKMSRVSQRL